MIDFFESDSFISPQEVRNDVANRLKETRPVKSLELLFKGDALEDAKEFAASLVTLKKQGVKVSHEFSIKLDFPQTISREKILSLVEVMPTSTNGSVKVRIRFNDKAGTPLPKSLGGINENQS